MSGRDSRIRELGGFVVMASLMVAVALPLTALAKSEKVTICHGLGQEGTTQFVTLEVAEAAAYGQAGHFYENGTPRAGHEADYLGACVDDTTTTTAETQPTIAVEETTTTTTMPEETTTTLSVEETTTTAPVVEEVAASVETTTTTTQPPAPTVAPPVTVPANVAAVAADSPEVGVDVLPFTGLDPSLVIPGSILLLVGAGFLFLTGGMFEVSGAHVAKDATRFSLGFHRGRHE